MKMEKIAIRATSPEQGKRVIEYLESLGGFNTLSLSGSCVNSYYFIYDDTIILALPYMLKGYTEAFLPEECESTERKLPEDINTFRAKAALMCLSFYEVEDEERFSKAVRDADELIKELNK